MSHEQKESGHRPLASGELSTAWELGEFFEALGPVMRLPPKDDEHSAAPARSTKTAPAKRRPYMLTIVAVVVLATAAFQGPLMRALFQDTAVPDEFLGRWETTAPRYADRGFTLTRDTLLLRLGSHGRASYPVSGVRVTESGDSVLYTVHYKDGSATLEMGLRMEADSTLRLANLPGVFWKKASS